MKDYRVLYDELNSKYRKEYEDTLKEIMNIQRHIKDRDDIYSEFLRRSAQWIVKIGEFEDKIYPDYIERTDFDELRKENLGFFHEILPENYERSYANPSYSVSIFGKKLGKYLSFFYTKLRGCLMAAFQHKVYTMAKYNRTFINLFESLSKDVDEERVKEIVTENERLIDRDEEELKLRETYDEGYTFYKEIVEGVNRDTRYIFMYGNYISDNETKFLEFINSLSKERIERLTDIMVEAYIKGFEKNNKSLEGKDTVTISFNIGYERMVKRLMEKFLERGLKPILSGVNSKPPNRQYIHDHRFDMGLYLDEEWKEKYLKITEQVYRDNGDILRRYSGVFIIDTFGEVPFRPRDKEEAINLSDEQKVVYKSLIDSFLPIKEKHIPSRETSFSIIAFPSPDIGEKFEEIFDKFVEINSLDPERYERLQQIMIDELDRCDYIHVKGKDGNETDITVSLMPLRNPERESKFLNCGADVNIPVGEVYTSPRLKGTQGLLHVKKAYLRGMEFVDLKLWFRDGFIEKYSCRNFDDDEKNRKLIEDVLLFPNKTLPMGEFAIGTNTLAYVVARRYNIVHLLPVLIVEKMGPHFAIGDTCFFMQEEVPVFNPDGKEMVARHNEKTLKKDENLSEAYTYKHIDITLPFDEIEHIAGFKEDGERVVIIEKGRFAMKELEELNEPFEDVE